MFDIFTTREMAIACYLTLIVLFVFIYKPIRPSAIQLVNIALSHQLVLPFIGMAIYCVVLVVMLAKFPFWNWIYIKDIIVWLIFAGIPTCYNAVNKNPFEHYFKKIIVDNLKLIVIVEFFISTFTFPLFLELLLQPFIAFILLIQVVAERKPEFKSVKKLIDWIIAILGCWIFYFTIKIGISTYSELGLIDTIASFVTPLIFSVLYLPVAYLFAVISKYEVVFIRMSFMESKSRLIRFKHRLRVIWVCKLSYKKIWRFEPVAVKEMFISMTDDDFNRMITKFKVGGIDD